MFIEHHTSPYPLQRGIEILKIDTVKCTRNLQVKELYFLKFYFSFGNHMSSMVRPHSSTIWSEYSSLTNVPLLVPNTNLTPAALAVLIIFAVGSL